MRALFDREYGYLRLKAKGGERLTVEFVSPADEGREEEAADQSPYTAFALPLKIALFSASDR